MRCCDAALVLRWIRCGGFLKSGRAIGLGRLPLLDLLDHLGPSRTILAKPDPPTKEI